MNRKETHMELDQKQKEVRISAQVGCLPTIAATHPDDCRLTWERTITIMFTDAVTATIRHHLKNILYYNTVLTEKGLVRVQMRTTVADYTYYS
jgi:hypothetical protein